MYKTYRIRQILEFLSRMLFLNISQEYDLKFKKLCFLGSQTTALL